MPWRCCVPGCRGYDEAKSMGVVFHGLPTRDPPRCRRWLRAIRNPRLHEDMPASKYGGVRVCSLHFTAEDYEEDFRAKILNVAPKPTLKSGAVPSVFPGKRRAEPGGAHAPAPAAKKSGAPVSCGAAGSSSQTSPPPLPPPPPPAAAEEEEEEENFCIVVSVDPLDERFHSQRDFTPVAMTTSDEEEEDPDEDCTIVSGRSLMELFRKCQICGQGITEKEVFHSGAQMKVRWGCSGGHSGVWKSSPHLKDP